MGECSDAFFAIQFPFAVERRIVLCGRNVSRRNRSAVDATTLPGRVAVHSDAIQLDDKRIAGPDCVIVPSWRSFSDAGSGGRKWPRSRCGLQKKST
jgi:hypothetical protein